MQVSVGTKNNLGTDFTFQTKSKVYLYEPTPFARYLIIVWEKNHCSHISGLFMEDFYFLALMVICAHPPHHPYGFLRADAGSRFWMGRSDLSHHPIFYLLQLK